MNTSEIWNLIRDSKEQNDNQIDYLIHTLSQIPVEDIIDYSIHFETCYRETYNSDLWGAAYIIMGGCSDDSFDYFRGWLIAQGEQVYKKVLVDPEYLAEYIPDYYSKKNLAPILKQMISLASVTYTYKYTSSKEYDDDCYNKYLDLMKAAKFNFIYPTIVFDWDDERDLAMKFPKLWDRFGRQTL